MMNWRLQMRFPALRPPSRAQLIRCGTVSVGLLSLLMASGCHTPLGSPGHLGVGARQAPNVYRSSERLPLFLRRVAVLPLQADLKSPELGAGRQALESVLQEELIKAGAFELTFITPAQLEQWTGKSRWNAEDKLAPDFFDRLRGQANCDAVLFCRLTAFRPYKPLQVGWNFKLVDSMEFNICWAVDEMFDAGEPPVARAAQRYHQSNFSQERAAQDPEIIEISPRRFGQYSLSEVIATLPKR
jgi:hypothetical protein